MRSGNITHLKSSNDFCDSSSPGVQMCWDGHWPPPPTPTPTPTPTYTHTHTHRHIISNLSNHSATHCQVKTEQFNVKVRPMGDSCQRFSSNIWADMMLCLWDSEPGLRLVFGNWLRQAITYYFPVQSSQTGWEKERERERAAPVVVFSMTNKAFLHACLSSILIYHWLIYLFIYLLSFLFSKIKRGRVWSTGYENVLLCCHCLFFCSLLHYFTPAACM